MRLDPGPQETCRHRQPHRAIFRGVQLHAAEPAGEDVLAELITELVLDPLPALPVRARHFGLLFFFGVKSSTEQLRRGRPHHAGHWQTRLTYRRGGAGADQSITTADRGRSGFSRWAWRCRAET